MENTYMYIQPQEILYLYLYIIVYIGGLKKVHVEYMSVTTCIHVHVHVRVMCKVRIQTIYEFRCANPEFKLCSNNPWIVLHKPQIRIPGI